MSGICYYFILTLFILIIEIDAFVKFCSCVHLNLGTPTSGLKKQENNFI